ncbi:hypothetical protein ACI6PS_11570 [Flavobacterium sp. PLA-1-15]|uniref:hypothetical protein n=1 Tax=Flavobacterium sp. PLA-1-15 TaxID=3380533 RepID=UPI003B7EFB51
MIDFVKIHFANINVIQLEKSKVLDFKTELSKSTGEIKESVLTANYHFCKITINKSNPQNPHVFLSGSLHKMWNDLNGIIAPNWQDQNQYNGYNGNQFNLKNIFEISSHLQDLFKCTSSQMVFQNIEFGVNTELVFKPQLYLKGLLYHKNIPFDFTHSGNSTQAKHQSFIFKIYNKSYQYKLPKNVLRVELKFIKMIGLKDISIRTFQDITIESLKNVSALLLKRFDEVVHYDYTINKNRLTKRQTLALGNYSNPRYWLYDLKPIHRDRHKKSLGKITVSHSDNLQKQIREEIHKKCVTINKLI